MTEREQPDRRSFERAETLARAWLVICGCVFLALGVGVAVQADGVDLWGIVIAVVGVAQFIAARYASARIVNLLAWRGL